MHVIEVDGKNTCMWRNCKFQEYSEPDLVIVFSFDNDVSDEDVNTQQVPKIANSKNDLLAVMMIGMWVIAIDEQEKWLGKVVKKKANQLCVRCLEKPFGINLLQDLEREENAVYFSRVFYTNVVPILTQTQTVGKDRNGYGGTSTHCKA